MTSPPPQLGPGARIRIGPPVLPAVAAAPPSLRGVVVVPAPGPPGPPGPAGVSPVEHVQAIPQAVWTVEHGLGRYPVAWSLIDTDGALCGEFVIEHLDVDTLRVCMDVPTAGTLRLI